MLCEIKIAFRQITEKNLIKQINANQFMVSYKIVLHQINSLFVIKLSFASIILILQALLNKKIQHSILRKMTVIDFFQCLLQNKCLKTLKELNSKVKNTG